MILVETLTKKDRRALRACAEILENTFECYKGEGRREMKKLLGKERVLLGAFKDGALIGLIGAIPQYGVTAWELHPLAVREDMRGQGVGGLLVGALERELKERGCLTVYLGSDDEHAQTSLSDDNLFIETYTKIEHIENRKRHPYEFYQKQGYQIVGVIPDANGIGKPDIWLAHSLAGR